MSDKEEIDWRDFLRKEKQGTLEDNKVYRIKTGGGENSFTRTTRRRSSGRE